MSVDKTLPKRDPLDEALEQTFPASDAIAIVTPRRPRRKKQEAQRNEDDDTGR